MTLSDDLHLETGTISTHGSGRQYWTDYYAERICFGQPFDTAPKVYMWFQDFDTNPIWLSLRPS